MSEKIKISAVSYLNTLPFIFGIESDMSLLNQIELYKDIPSVCADKLISGDVDLGLIPVAEIRKINDPRIISDFCIGAIGNVSTVLLLSDVPVNEIKYIYLDYQSRTSVNLLKILAKEYWNINPIFIDAIAGYEDLIKDDKAGLIIGDRTFIYSKKFPFIYDLSDEWLIFTGLPFVFAAWVANKELPESFLKLFNDALRFGLENKDRAITKYRSMNPNSDVDIEKYLEYDISYSFDQEKKKGLDLFLKMLKST